MGYSTGHWEDDVLVVETDDIYKGTRMSIPAPGNGELIDVRHSEDMHLTERIRLIDDDTLEIRTTVTDPALFEGGSPNFLKRRYRTAKILQPGDEVSLQVYAMRDGQPGAIMIAVTLPDGTTLTDIPPH